MSDILEVASQTEQYLGSVDRWHVDHQAAMLRYDVEETIAVGNRVFDAIVAIDEDWRHRVMRGELAFSPVLQSLIFALFKRWHAPCDEILELEGAATRTPWQARVRTWARRLTSGPGHIYSA